ncbi:MAG: extracellular solute-binding protein [Lachnospiraceae bacterium]|nr:extracellular solute-binding protein [Lachnospiraceae bacterium]
MGYNRGKFLNISKRLVSAALAMMLVVADAPSAFALAAGGDPLKDKYSGFEGRKVDWAYGASENLISYSKTMDKLKNIPYASETIDVDLSTIRDESGVIGTIDWEGRKAVYSDAKSEKTEFEVTVKEDALYSIEIDYWLQTGMSDSAKRALYVDGDYPFTEAGDLEFYRFFKDEGEPILNSIGNQTRPKQIEVPGWYSQGLTDTSGITTNEFLIHLTPGTHTLTFVNTKVGMYISGIRVAAPKVLKSYAEVAAEYASKGYTETKAEKIEFQAELNAILKNDPTLRRENDGDPLVHPVSGTSRMLNVIGAYRWRTGNQSITWEFEVPEDGLYKIGLYVKQMWNDGLPSYRQIEIDGEIPFKEFEIYKFEYDTNWKVHELGEKGNPYSFYLTKGKHTITMTVKMGDLSEILESIQDDIAVISDMLLDISMIAGSSPDPNYDYQFFKKIPDMEDNMKYLVDSLSYKYELCKGISEKMPAMGNNFLSIRTDIEKMLNDPFSIAKRFGALQDSQTSLSEWYLALQSVPLVIDEFYVGAPSEKWESVSSNFFQKLAITFQQFLTSFTKDYDNVGSVLAEDVVVKDTIEVWIARGTEWAEVIKEMADEDFTPKTGIAIDVNVLPGTQLDAGNVNAIMLSITSGKAPDVALGVDVTSPVEFAIRDQVYDLSKLNGFDEVEDRFVEATLTPYKYRGGVYAIPETMNFNVMYYRKDLLKKYGIDLPDTWEDLYEFVLPALYQNGFEFYFARDFSQFLFQNGGSYYTEDGLKSALDTPEAYHAFKEYTELFTNYNVPETANFYQYFRSGIMPLGVGDFNMYMQLQVGAPEIAGKWGIISLPGHTTADGTIDRTAGAITEKGDIILKQSDKPEQSWEFLKWWSSAEVQTQFAKEVEAMMGAEARWNTANKEAFLSLSWSDEDIEALNEEWKWAREIPTVLGGYMTARHLTNAWTSVVISGKDVRESLEQAVKDINRELRMKQEEYGVIADE